MSFDEYILLLSPSVRVHIARVFRLFHSLTGGDKLVDKSLRNLGLLHDAFAVVLPDRARELVVVHGRPVLPQAPKSGDLDRVLDLEDT